MENKRVLFITFDLSGYYDSVYRELQQRYAHVDYFNTATVRFRYKNFGQKLYSFFYKLFTGRKLKNFYKYQQVIEQVQGNRYDITLMVRPDLFFDSQLATLKQLSGRFIAYYHDSINNLKRKKDVIHFFDKVYAYEKNDVQDHGLDFLTNFIYFDAPETLPEPQYDVFSVMADDYRTLTVKNLAAYLRKAGRSYIFYVMKDGSLPNSGLVTYMDKRMDNTQVTACILQARCIADIHKYGVQDGLTFRTFEALGYRKKLITTNKDVVTYDFYDPNNIFVMEDRDNINIPNAFFETPYLEVPQHIYDKYTVKAWLDRVLS